MTASFAFPFAAPSSHLTRPSFSPSILPFLYFGIFTPSLSPSLFFVPALCSRFLPPFTILCALPLPFRIVSPFRPLPPTFPLPFIGHPLTPALTAVPISFYGLQGSKHQQFEEDCFPGAVGQADRILWLSSLLFVEEKGGIVGGIEKSLEALLPSVIAKPDSVIWSDGWSEASMHYYDFMRYLIF